MDEKKLTASEVRAWLSQVDADLRRLANRLEPLLAEQRGLDERKTLLQNLLRSFDSTGTNGAASPAGSRPSGSVARYVIDRAVELLREEGAPLHINDLHARFLERGLTVPGAGKPVNLTVHLRDAEEIASPMRGVYGLTEQVGAVPRQTTPRRRRKKARPRTQGRKT